MKETFAVFFEHDDGAWVREEVAFVFAKDKEEVASIFTDKMSAIFPSNDDTFVVKSILKVGDDVKMVFADGKHFWAK